MNKSICGWKGLATVLLAALVLAGTAHGQQAREPSSDPHETFTDYGRVSRKVIEPSNEGVWDGTWFYVNRDGRMVMWIKTEQGVPKIKLRYISTATAEGFETDWNGEAEYQMPKSKGFFSLNIKKRNADLIEGHFDWRLEGEHSTRQEEGDYTMYRTGDGRFFVLDFSRHTKSLSSSAKGKRTYESTPSWTFQKASKRLALWDELPF
jgi:hypothetical protein